MDVEKDTAQFSDLAADILRRHDNREPEANITSAVRDFLINSGLVRAEDSKRRTRRRKAPAKLLICARSIPLSSSNAA